MQRGRGRDPHELFVRYLKSKGKNVTEARRRIVEAVFSMHGHFDASDLWAKLRGAPHNLNISISTVYRTLHLLADAGLIRKVSLGEPHAHWEHVFSSKEHGHLVCLGCGKVIEFSSKEVEEALERVLERYKFQYWRRNLEIFGLCAECSSGNGQGEKAKGKGG